MEQTIKHFEFGKNWLQFIEKNLDQERINISKQHMLNFLKRSDLKNLSFLDIGCGSGLHSISAFEAQASNIYSFDYDPISVKATQYIQSKINNPKKWHTEQGSVLDNDYISSLPQFDLVYSWGVLHHTGDVWRGIRNAASRVKPNGLFYIALYSADMQIDPTPEFWLQVKQKYIASGQFTRCAMDFWYIWRFCMNRKLWNLPALLLRIHDYKKSRGMNFLTDIRDWLGGWPMEFVYDAEVVKFCKKIGFRLENIKTGEANTEFLFIKEKR